MSLPYLSFSNTHTHTPVEPLYQVQGCKRLPNKLRIFLLTAVSVYECSDVGQPWNAKQSSGSIKGQQGEVWFQLLDSNGTHSIARNVLPVKSDVAFNYLGSREQIAVKVSWQSVNRDSGLLIVAAVSELMPNRLGQVLLVELAALHRLITAHAVTDTGNAGDLWFGTSGKCLNWRNNHELVVSVCAFVCVKAPVSQICVW